MDDRKREEFHSASVYCSSNNNQNTVISRWEKSYIIEDHQSQSE